MKKLFRVISVLLILFSVMEFSASAAPTGYYTHPDEPDGSFTARLSRGMYEAADKITATSLGIETSLSGVTDLCSADDGSVYILCGEDSKLYRLNGDYSLECEITLADENGENVSFAGARGIFVSDESLIYLSDTENARVIVSDKNGKIIKYIYLPKSELIPEDFNYQPVAAAVDNDGYTYILSLGCYYGALIFSPAGEFIGFYGSNTVNASALDTVAFLWDKLTGTDAKRKASVKTLPYSFVDFAIDNDGYMIVCNVAEKEGNANSGQIKKIGTNGSNILYKRLANGETASSSAVNLLEGNGFTVNGSYHKQELVAVDADENGFIYALDKAFGCVYVFDSECRLLNVFAGGYKSGAQAGVFKDPVALTVHGEDILVADKGKGSVTVFAVTEYGSLLKQAHCKYIKGDYQEAAPLWEQVLSMDRGNQAAYRGLAMNSYLNGDYRQSLEYARQGLDYSVYDLAKQQLFSEFISRWFLLILLVIIAIIVFAVKAVAFCKKRGIFSERTKAGALLRVPFHPVHTFNDIKYLNCGSVKAAVGVTLLLYISVTLKNIASGFLYSNVSAKNYNMLYTLAQTVGLLMLWSVSNWLVSSLFSGNGSFKEVFIASAYSTLPLSVSSLLYVVLSHFLPLYGVDFMNGLQTAALMLTAFILCIAICTVHEYDFFKFFGTTVATVLFMILAVFVVFLFSTLLSQVIELISDLYNEIAFR